MRRRSPQEGIPPFASPLWAAEVPPVAKVARWPLSAREWLDHCKQHGLRHGRNALAWLETTGRIVWTGTTWKRERSVK